MKIFTLLAIGLAALAIACGVETTATNIPTAVPTPLPSPVVPVIERPTEAPAESVAEPTPTPAPIGGWSAAAALNDARSGHVALLLADGRVLVAGGSGDEGFLASAEIYDPESDSWLAVASMNEPRVNARAAVLDDGRVLVTGGSNAEGDIDDLASAEIYDPALDQWQPLPQMASRRALHSATLMADGRVLVSGGFDGEE